MALIDTITVLWRRIRQQNRDAPRRTTGDETLPPPRPTEGLAHFGVENDRRSEVTDCRAMYREDTRGKGVVQTLARDAVRGGFRVKVSGGGDVATAQQIADELVKRLNLFSRLDDWTRLTVRDGDSFLEVSVDEGQNIVDVTRKPTLQMHRASDEFDRFTDPTRAYWWADELWAGQGPPASATWFAEWQIIHARWSHDEGSRYGTPLFAPARRAYKRMVEGEFDIAIRRKTRSGMKYLHVLEDGDETTIKAYREQNKDALNNPFSAVADFFTNRKGSIQTIQGDAHLAEIDDVIHHIRTWWVASPVPMSLLGYGQDLNRDVLEKQKQQYDEALPTITRWVEEQIVVPLLELQWLLQGIWPEGLEYELIWAAKRVVTPADIRDLADALNKLKATQLFTEEALLTIAATVLPDFDVAAALEALEAERERRRQEQPDEIDRIAIAAREASLARAQQAQGQQGQQAGQETAEAVTTSGRGRRWPR